MGQLNLAAFGRVFQSFDASGDERRIMPVYNARGYVEQILEARDAKRYTAISQQDAYGHVTAETLGNGISVTRTFDAKTGAPKTRDDGPAGDVLHQDYGFDRLGNLTRRNTTFVQANGSALQSQSEAFHYDALNRLSNFQINGQAQQRITYDIAGNLTSKYDVAGS